MRPLIGRGRPAPHAGQPVQRRLVGGTAAPVTVGVGGGAPQPQHAHYAAAGAAVRSSSASFSAPVVPGGAPTSSVRSSSAVGGGAAAAPRAVLGPGASCSCAATATRSLSNSSHVGATTTAGHYQQQRLQQLRAAQASQSSQVSVAAPPEAAPAAPLSVVTGVGGAACGARPGHNGSVALRQYPPLKAGENGARAQDFAMSPQHPQAFSPQQQSPKQLSPLQSPTQLSPQQPRQPLSAQPAPTPQRQPQPQPAATSASGSPSGPAQAQSSDALLQAQAPPSLSSNGTSQRFAAGGPSLSAVSALPGAPPGSHLVASPLKSVTRASSTDSEDDLIAPSRTFSACKRGLLISTINFIFRTISRDVEVETMPNRSTFEVFVEEQYHRNKAASQFLEPFTRTLHDCSACHVTEFILMMLHRGYFDVSEFIISVLYLVRFRDRTGISLHVRAWRPLFITALLIADKMWEDKSVKNSSLTQLFPVLTTAELFELEARFLEWLGFSAWITKQEFDSFCEGLMRIESMVPEISAQVLRSEYAAALQDGTVAAPPSAKPTSNSRRPKPTRPEQPWNLRKTLHAYSPPKRPATGQPALPPGKVPQLTQETAEEVAFNSLSPRRKPLATGAGIASASNWKSGGLQHTVSVGAVRPRSTDGSGTGGQVPANSAPSHGASAAVSAASANSVATPAGPAGGAMQSPRRQPAQRAPERPAAPTYGHAPQPHERRPTSEPRVAAHPAQQQMLQHAQQFGGSLSAQAPAKLHGQVAASSAGGTMPASRCESEPATLGRAVAPGATQVGASVRFQAEAAARQPNACGMQASSMQVAAAQHSRSASTVAQVSKPPPPVVQRCSFPFGPNSRSTVPMPGASARTFRPTPAGHPLPAQDPRRVQPPSGAGGVAGPQASGVVQAAAILGRGRSSSPAAGIADGGFAPPPSARRNVAAPPPTVRPVGLRYC